MEYKKPLIVRVTPKLSKCEVAHLKKDKVQMNATHIDTWVEDQTVRYERPDGSTLFTLVHDVDPQKPDAYAIYRKVAANKPTRAAALGLPMIRMTKRDGTLAKFLRVDPNHPRLKYARDGVMGALDPTKNKADYGRLTKYDVNLIPPVLQHTKLLTDIYAVYEPESYQRQLAAIQQVHPHWTILGTPFSTVTCNWCFPTFLHVEGSDFKPGLGIITVHYSGECPMSWLVFCRYQIAVLVKPGDILIADVGNEMHGNTQIPFHDGYGSTSGRLSTIHYLRPKLSNCGTPEQEAEKRDTNKRRK
jgi:hypothetical protein